MTIDTMRDREVPDFGAFSCPLEQCDPVAYEALNKEIQDCRQAGYEVTVGVSNDPAYDRPDKIIGVYHSLRESDKQLEAEKLNIRRVSLGQLGLNPLKWSQRRAKHAYQSLEPLRDELLFGEDQADAKEWHQQRGRATALLTIALAHELQIDRVGAEAGYPTMSGMLDDSVLEYTFPERSGLVSGMSIKEALIATEVQYSGRNKSAAERKTASRLEETAAFINAPNSERFVDIVRYCSDALGIRSRKEEVGEVISDHLTHQYEHNQRQLGDMLMLSFGSGTALPMLEIMRDIRQKFGDCPSILLIDQDPLALAAAAVIAEKMGLADKIELRCERLFDKFGKPLDLGPILEGRKITVAEDSGLREYLPDSIYVALTTQTWQHLEPGGIMTTGNMNANRPQREFLHGMMGWQPRVQMRYMKDGFRLHEQSGIPRGATRARATRDGIYTLYLSEK